MRIEENYSLEKHNTFHLPVKARWFMEYTNEEELGRIFRDEYFQECLSLHIGSGSNLLFINDFNGVILHSQIKGISVAKETDDSVLLRIGAAEKWDDVVAYAASPKGWGGNRNLSGIPGEVGAAAVQEYRGNTVRKSRMWSRRWRHITSFRSRNVCLQMKNVFIVIGIVSSRMSITTRTLLLYEIYV